MIHLPFLNRAEAGRMLADELTQRKITRNVSVLALPRGGVPVGFEVAKMLRADLDVVVVRKRGVPYQPELAMGAIASGSFQTLDQDLIRALGISRQEISAGVGRGESALHGRTVVLVDDGPPALTSA